MHSIPIHRTARYVRLQRSAGSSQLVFTEVQIWSELTGLGTLSDPGGLQTQSKGNAQEGGRQ